MIRLVSFLFATLMFCSTTSAGSGCTASNTDENTRCVIDCPEGQQARCTDAQGSGVPICECIGELTGATKFSAKPTRKFLAGPSFENTNLQDVINKRLSTLPPHHLSDSCHVEPDPSKCQVTTHCHGGIDRENSCSERTKCQDRTVCAPINGPLTVGLPLLVSKGPNVKLTSVAINNVPTIVKQKTGTFTNCSSERQDESFSHQVSFTKGSTVSKTKTVTTGRTETTTVAGHVDFKYPVISGGVSANRSVAINSSLTLTDANQESSTTTESESENISLHIAPQKKLEHTHYYVQMFVAVPFTGTIVVDGPIQSNLDGIKLLSEVLPSEAERTFDFAGVVEDSTQVDTQTSSYESPAKCAAGDTLYKIAYTEKTF